MLFQNHSFVVLTFFFCYSYRILMSFLCFSLRNYSSTTYSYIILLLLLYYCCTSLRSFFFECFVGRRTYAAAAANVSLQGFARHPDRRGGNEIHANRPECERYRCFRVLPLQGRIPYGTGACGAPAIEKAPGEIELGVVEGEP